jgi:hypothetical protein
MRDVIAIDVVDPQFYRNQLFDQAAAVKYPGVSAMVEFKKMGIAAGFQVITADMVEELKIDCRRVMVIASDRMRDSQLLAQRGALLTALFCFETPSFAWHFYYNLDKISAQFRHAFIFPGAASRIKNSLVNFHPTLFPQPYRQIQVVGERAWSKRKFAAMVHHNQVRLVVKPAHLIAALIDPDLRCELYSERRKAIRYFHRHKEFHLYGSGWERWRLGVSYGDYRAALRCYQGRCGNKIDKLAEYRFSICYDNTIFPGYITEKIFDCFYAGCVPVYLGAPDISDYIPKECFIDKRKFSNYKDLDRFLLQVGPVEFEGYHQAISDFLNSKAFEPFYQEYFARKLLLAVQECAVL